MILRCLWIERPNREFLELDRRYDSGFLSATDLRRYAADPQYELSPDLVERELALGHRCLAIRDRDVLASYGWYCTGPTRFTDTLWVRFDREWVYMHKGFTHPGYRGRRLHAIGMTLALTTYLAEGFRGLVTIVEADNLASLTSCARMGYRRFGTIYTVRAGRLIGLQRSPRLLDRALVLATPGCRAFGFRLEHVRDTPGSATHYLYFPEPPGMLAFDRRS